MCRYRKGATKLGLRKTDMDIYAIIDKKTGRIIADAYSLNDARRIVRSNNRSCGDSKRHGYKKS